MLTPHQEQSIKLGDGPITTVKLFKRLGRLFADERGTETDVINRVSSVKMAWDKWGEVAGVMCDIIRIEIPIKLKDVQNHSQASNDNKNYTQLR